MELAIEAARQCKGATSDPLVGAVAVSNGQLLGTAFRGEKKAGEHAEYTLLERHLQDTPLAGATIYTTLEPCTNRNRPKVACVDRLIQRKVSRVVIGILDPNPLVSGFGYRKLRQANIIVDMFPPDLMAQLEELNRDFIHAIETDAIYRTTQEIAALSKRPGTPCQRIAVGTTLRECLDSLRRINSGQILIPGREAGYFMRLLELIDAAQETEHIKAFIRLNIFEPDELRANSWFDNFYERFEEAVHAKKVTVQYIFLLRTNELTDDVKRFIDRFKRFAGKIKYIHQHDSRLTPEILHPSIVLLENQMVAFTHDRGDDGSLIEATEWVYPDNFKRLQDQYNRIELISTMYFHQDE